MDITKKEADPDAELGAQHVSHVEKFRDFEQTKEDGGVERGLKSRHIQLIALGNN